MRYMIIERYLQGAAPIYARLNERGRQLPAGVEFVDSWVSEDLTCCYQLVACDDARMLEPWMDAWRDLVAFEVVPVISTAQAAEKARRGV